MTRGSRRTTLHKGSPAAATNDPTKTLFQLTNSSQPLSVPLPNPNREPKLHSTTRLHPSKPLLLLTFLVCRIRIYRPQPQPPVWLLLPSRIRLRHHRRRQC